MEFYMKKRPNYYSWERCFLRDEETGVKITRLTSFPTVNMKFYFHWNAFTPDSRTLVFLSWRYAGRKAPMDVWRVDVSGENLAQVTQIDDIGNPFLSYDGKWLYYINGKGDLFRKPLFGGAPEKMGSCGEVDYEGGNGSMPMEGEVFFAEATLKSEKKGLIRYDLNTGHSELIFEDDYFVHTQCEPRKGESVAIQYRPKNGDARYGIWLLDQGGGNLRPVKVENPNGHWMWSYDGRLVCNVSSPPRHIEIAHPDGGGNLRIENGMHLWHSCISFDNNWLVADTQNPDLGIYLFSLRTGRAAKLCNSLSSNCHPQYTHPHPSFSPDGKTVIFNSDMTGIPHVYAVEVPDRLKEELAERGK